MPTRIQLRPVEPADDPFLRELERRPEIRDRIGGLNPRKLSRGYFRLATLEGAPVGVVALVPCPATGQADLQLVCATRTGFEGEGIASDASRALLIEYGTPIPPARIVACVAPDNPAGARVAAKLGFQRLDARTDKGEVVLELRTQP